MKLSAGTMAIAVAAALSQQALVATAASGGSDARKPQVQSSALPGQAVPGAAMPSAKAGAVDPVVVGDTMNIHGTVVSVDREARLVELRAEDGRPLVLRVGSEVRNLEHLKPGDELTATAGEALAVAVPERKREIQPRIHTEISGQSPQGAKPALRAMERTTIVAEVVDKDEQSGRMTLRGPDGTEFRVALDESMRSRVDTGDQLIVTWVESTALSVARTDGGDGAQDDDISGTVAHRGSDGESRAIKPRSSVSAGSDMPRGWTQRGGADAAVAGSQQPQRSGSGPAVAGAASSAGAASNTSGSDMGWRTKMRQDTRSDDAEAQAKSGEPQYDPAVERLMQAAQSLRESIQELATQGELTQTRRDAIAEAHDALYSTHQAMVVAASAGDARSR